MIITLIIKCRLNQYFLFALSVYYGQWLSALLRFICVIRNVLTWNIKT